MHVCLSEHHVNAVDAGPETEIRIPGVELQQSWAATCVPGAKPKPSTSCSCVDLGLQACPTTPGLLVTVDQDSFVESVVSGISCGCISPKSRARLGSFFLVQVRPVSQVWSVGEEPLETQAAEHSSMLKDSKMWLILNWSWPGNMVSVCSNPITHFNMETVTYFFFFFFSFLFFSFCLFLVFTYELKMWYLYFYIWLILLNTMTYGSIRLPKNDNTSFLWLN